MEKIKRCPHCNNKSIRRWLTNGYVRCLDCNKISKYSEWKEDEVLIPDATEHIDMHDVFEEYIKATNFMKIDNPKVFTSKECPVCGLVHSEVQHKTRYAILIVFYHLRSAFIFYRTFKKIKRVSKRQAKGKKSIREKRYLKKIIKELNERKRTDL